ncbi:hypothetical protein AVEN_218057-1 [Araneus ventricosus]|uniref:Uncharacterized protein n=1 Tax=Araneus ventricosus TaxID=182803 RepID=A0A4Y2MLU4_ARAVE|nr:hypothetical protein AVEN_218057-1 [Araneus ventricosus]
MKLFTFKSTMNFTHLPNPHETLTVTTQSHKKVCTVPSQSRRKVCRALSKSTKSVPCPLKVDEKCAVSSQSRRKVRKSMTRHRQLQLN